MNFTFPLGFEKSNGHKTNQENRIKLTYEFEIYLKSGSGRAFLIKRLHSF